MRRSESHAAQVFESIELPPRSRATTWERAGIRPSMFISSRTSITSTGWWRPSILR